MNYKIAVVMPVDIWDYLVDTILDGLIQLQKKHKGLEFFLSPESKSSLDISQYVLPKDKFVSFAREADFILLMGVKGNSSLRLAGELGMWSKTVFIDASELGNNKRYDFKIQRDVLLKEYKHEGRINDELLRLCPLYFRREKPYIDGILPLPYGIISYYRKHYNLGKKKDIDFCCIFGQDEYPLMRRYARELLVKYCEKNGFSYHIEKTSSRDEFYELLSRSKVGISIGGGGFDTARFWEILGNNCILMTEKVDVFKPDDGDLDYEMIYQFSNLYDFQYQLEKVGKFLNERYDKSKLQTEYEEILSRHSSEARALEVIETIKARFEEIKENKKKCSIMISSFDGNEDLWEPFFTLFFRYWPDCPFPIYLTTNYKKYNHDKVNTITVGEDRGWASNTRTALRKLSTPYVLCLLEDYFIEKPVDINYVDALVKYINDEKVAHIRLFPSPLPDSDFPNDLHLGTINKGTSYRVSLQAGLWDKEVLDGLLIDGENAWQMEMEGSKRSNNVAMPFLSVKKPALIYNDRSAVIRGRWAYDAVKLCRLEGVKIDTKKRSILYSQAIASFLDKVRKHFFLRKIRQIPIIGYFGVMTLKFMRYLLKKNF